MKKNLVLFVVTLYVMAFLDGCSSMAINKAEFEVNSHPNFIGIGKNAKKNTKLKRT